LDADSIIREASGADALFLCNPNNPTGLLATREIERIVESVNRRTTIMLDECFVELVDKPDKNSMVSRIQEFENLVILRSLTKSFGLAGLRVGYSVSNPGLAVRMSKNRIPWNVNGIAQAAGVAALADTRHLPRTRVLIRKEREVLFDRIGRMKTFSPHRSDANYFMVRLHGRNSTEFRDALLKKRGLLVRDCSTFTGMNSEYVRVAVKNHKENLMLVRALEDFDRV
ncbi:MAG: histidinol-phosphate aminotransferase family protein, partial [Nitrososphaera sp.]|nr:histidinol-phosphate aminotransferase family protein [Nitrososphaera sp.]